MNSNETIIRVNYIWKQNLILISFVINQLIKMLLLVEIILLTSNDILG